MMLAVAFCINMSCSIACIKDREKDVVAIEM